METGGEMCVYVCDGRYHLVCCARMYSDYEKNTARLLDTLRDLGCIRSISVYRFCCPSRLLLSDRGGEKMNRLKWALDVKCIRQKTCAAFLGVSEKALYNKMTGTNEFTYSEVKRLKELLPEFDIGYLLDN